MPYINLNKKKKKSCDLNYLSVTKNIVYDTNFITVFQIKQILYTTLVSVRTPSPPKILGAPWLLGERSIILSFKW